jgi:4-hydroxybenzoate polyprenyltransferase
MSPAAAPASLGARVRRTLELIRFGHSVFALPFALLALVLACGGWPPPALLGWVLLAMVAARSAAMGMNRLADRHLDAHNPRTAGRHLVTGALSVRYVAALTLACSALFVLAAWRVNLTALALSPAVLLVVLGYPYLKRFTALAHLGVGLALGLSPLGAWVAGAGGLAGDLGLPLLLGAAVLCWVSGFDVIYACQDVEVDRRLGLRSIPARVGTQAALSIAAWLHLACLTLFALVAHRAGLRPWFLVALGASALLLLRAHLLARRAGIGPANAVLMPLNGVVALVLGAAGIADVLLAR